jgi:hypothetical protein
MEAKGIIMSRFCALGIIVLVAIALPAYGKDQNKVCSDAKSPPVICEQDHAGVNVIYVSDADNDVISVIIRAPTAAMGYHGGDQDFTADGPFTVVMSMLALTPELAKEKRNSAFLALMAGLLAGQSPTARTGRFQWSAAKGSDGYYFVASRLCLRYSC